MVGIAPVVWDKPGGAANVLLRHKVENNPVNEWVAVLACIEAASVRIDWRIEDVDVVLTVRWCSERPSPS